MTPGVTDAWTLGVILGMAAVNVLSRCFFFILERQWKGPAWVDRALNYAPVAALAAVVAPEVLLAAGQLVLPWQNARLIGAVVGVLAYALSRSVLITMLAGMAAYLPLHIGLGW